MGKFRFLALVSMILNLALGCGEDTGKATNNGVLLDQGADMEADNSPEICAQNQYRVEEECMDCRPGFIADETGTNCVPRMCEANQFVSLHTCVACPPGTFSGGGNASGADTQCYSRLCGADEHVSNHECVPCMAGTTNMPNDDASGSDTSCDSALCASNQFVFNHTCTPCPNGMLRAAGDDASGPDTQCDAVICGVNQYVSNYRCMMCPPGTSNSGGDDASGDDTHCAAVMCDVGERVSNHTCLPCPPGMTSDGGDAQGADTSCETVICAENEHVFRNRCVACPGTDSNQAGDWATGEDTSCDGDACPTNQYVWGNVCAPCRAGTTNPAGDDPSGPDSSCAPTLCSTNEYVSGHVCVPCPAGTENDAGNDASGPDTTCRTVDPCAMVLGVVCSDFNEAYIKASNTEANDSFGFVLALHRDTLVVSAPYEDSNATGVNGNQNDNSLSGAGAVYVFVRTGSTWTQEAYIKASNPGVDDNFGRSVAIYEDTLVVGAPYEDSNAIGVNGNQANNSEPESGAVYVFRRSGSQWSQEAYIKASNTEMGDRFGTAVAIHGDILAVSAPNEGSGSRGIGGVQSNNDMPGSGAVYVFSRAGSTWSQQAYIKASNADAGDGFGASLAIHGDTLVASALGESSSSSGVNGDQSKNDLGESGAVYVFLQSGSSWSQQAYIKASNPGEIAYFGSSLSIDEDTLVVGASNESSDAVGINGDQDNDNATFSGAVYVFTRSGSNWSQEAYIKASNAENNDNFGRSVAIYNDTLAVGAWGESSSAIGLNGNQADNSKVDSGAVYLFTRSNTMWSQQAYVKASNTDMRDLFGGSVALNDKTLVIASPSERSSARGINGDQSDNSTAYAGAAYVRRIAP